jgi:hypothetical protein
MSTDLSALMVIFGGCLGERQTCGRRTRIGYHRCESRGQSRLACGFRQWKRVETAVPIKAQWAGCDWLSEAEGSDVVNETMFADLLFS